MNATLKNILATLLTAAVIGNVTFLWQVNARLARLETQVEILTGHQTIASK